jgi:chromodomain-helicase-DNA-binding protein 1
MTSSAEVDQGFEQISTATATKSVACNISASDEECGFTGEITARTANSAARTVVTSSENEYDASIASSSAQSGTDYEPEDNGLGDDSEYDSEDADSEFEDSEDEIYGQRKKPLAKRATRRSADSEDDDEEVYKASKTRKRPSLAKKGKRKAIQSGIVSDTELSADSDESDFEAERKKARNSGKWGAANVGEIPFAAAHDDQDQVVDSIADWNEEKNEVLVKWKGQSHLWCRWVSLDDDSVFAPSSSNLRKLENFLNKIEEEREDSEDLVSLFLETLRFNYAENYRVVERIAASRQPEGGRRADDVGAHYLVKWRALGYAECSWEWEGDVRGAEGGGQAIDDFLDRQYRGGTISGRKAAKRFGTGSFRPFTSAPEFLLQGCERSLRDYQLDGLNWLLYSWCLADEMGLGKTIQTVCFLSALLQEYGFSGPSLVVVPLSTIDAWQREFAKWARGINTVVYVGDAQSRAVIRNYEFSRTFHVLLTTYELVLKDQELLSQTRWKQLVVDEGHRLKNASSQLYDVLYSLVPSGGRLLITGTPLQNSLGELWCLLRFLMPDKFNDYDAFVARYSLDGEDEAEETEAEGDAIGERSANRLSQKHQDRLSELHALIKPHILRRLKRDVEKSLPGKTERIIRVDLSAHQKELYRHILARNYLDLRRAQEAAGVKGSTSLINVLGELQKLCNHPVLCSSSKREPLQIPSPISQDFLAESGKLALLQRLLRKLRSGGNRVLIFSQSVRMLDVLEAFVRSEGYQWQRLDGGTASAQRQRSIAAFNAPDSPNFCFLLSTRAGGLGINLATADTVIIYDSDWNPQNDLQAMARAHRIGQTKEVRIFRLVSAGTIEEEILERAKRKMVLDHLVIQKLKKTSANGASGSGASTVSDLQAILKFGAQALFSQESPALPASAIDLDAILTETGIRQEESQENADEELQAQFKIADLSALPDWDEIIPETDRRAQEAKAASEAVLKKELELQEALLTSAIGRRKLPTESESVAKRRKAKMNADEAADAEIPVLFDAASRVTDEELDELVKFGRECAVLKAPALLAKLALLPDASSWRLAAEGLVHKGSLNKERVLGLCRLRSSLEAFSANASSLDQFASWRHPLIKGIRGPANWTCFKGVYGVREDSMLLAAIGLHGYGNWTGIKADLVRKDAAWTAIQPVQLTRRAEYLLKGLSVSIQRSESSQTRTKAKGAKRPNGNVNVSVNAKEMARASSPSIDEQSLIERYRRPFKPMRSTLLSLDNLKEAANDPVQRELVGQELARNLQKLGDFVKSNPALAEDKLAWTFIATFWPFQEHSSASELKALYEKLK